MAPDLNPDGPHSPDRTRDAANILVAAIRYLNYATMYGSGGLEYPADVYALLSDVAAAFQAAPQLLDQAGAFLRAQAAAGQAGDDQGRDPVAVAAEASTELEVAGWKAGDAWLMVKRAQGLISGLHAKRGAPEVPGA